MSLSRRVRLRRALDGADHAVPPTPQTVAKLRHDVVGRLIARGRLHPLHAGTVEEIRSVCEAVGRGMFPTAQPAGEAGRSGWNPATRDFLDRMTARERALWQRRYLPWTRELAASFHPRLPGGRFLNLVLDIVVENVGLRTAERRYGLRNGAALVYLSLGLDRYAWRAGRRAPDEGFG